MHIHVDIYLLKIQIWVYIQQNKFKKNHVMSAVSHFITFYMYRHRA